MRESIGASVGLLVGLVAGISATQLAMSHSAAVGFLAVLASITFIIALMMAGAVIGSTRQK
jgi:hypothetical protein